MLLPLLLLLQPSEAPRAPTELDELQYEQCTSIAVTEPSSAVVDADLWAQEKGGYLAMACKGAALANDGRYAMAALILIDAAKSAAANNDHRTGRFWAEAGNAAIAGGLADQALSSLDAALAAPGVIDTDKADIQIDRARALVMLERNDDATAALASARQLSPESPGAWLFSATLARRMDNLGDAYTFIQTAAALSPRDAAVALEAGNIAAAAGNEDVARTQWEQVSKIAPSSPQAETAKARLAAMSESAPAAKPIAETPADPVQSR